MQTTQNFGLSKPEDTDVMDIQALNGNMDIVDAEMKKQRTTYNVNLTVAGWNGSAAPYSQTVTVAGITAEMEPLLVSALAEGATEAAQKAYSKTFGIVSSGTAATAAGKVTFRVYKKPTTDIMVGLKGV